MERLISFLIGPSILLLPLLTGCEYRLDPERAPSPRGTFGEEVHRIVQQDLDRDQLAKGQALGAERDRFVRSVDATMPTALLDSLQEFLIQMLPLYDSGEMQAVLRPAACKLKLELSVDTDLHQALWYADRPTGYGETELLSSLVRRIGVREDTDELLVELIQLWLEHDGLDGEFRPSGEDTIFADLLSDLAIWLGDRTVEPIEPAGDWAVTRDWLFSEDFRLDDGTPNQWLVRTDQRGRALVAIDIPTGQVRPPFVDQDQDGLADVDPANGDYLGADGLPIDVPAPIGPSGQRSLLDGQLLYKYADLRIAVLSAILEQIEPLVQEGLLWDTPEALPSLLGPLEALADNDGVYAGYDPDQSPAVALLHALLVAIDYDRLPQILETIGYLFEHSEPQLARLLDQIDRVSEIIDSHPDISTRDHNRLLDDLIPHLLAMARRNYILRVLETFDDPRWFSLQPGLAEMIRYRSVVPAGWNYYDDYDTYNHYLQVRQPMVWSAPDSIYDNRSNLQRGVHLIHDTDQIRHSVSVAGWEPFPIEDMLAFYLDSTASLVHVEWYVVGAVLEFSSEYPTTEEVNRFMVNDHSILGNPVGREGIEIRQYNGEALMALEFSGALTGLRPLWETLVALDRGSNISGTRILAGLLAATHPHYSCNLPYASQACADLRPLEPMLLEILDNTEVLDSLVELLISLQGRQTPSGYWVLSELDRFVLHLLEPDADISRFDGSASVLANDDVTPVFPISRLYLLMDAFRLVDDAVAADPAAEAAFERAAEHLSDRFLQVDQVGGNWRFTNARTRILLLNLLDFARTRVEKLHAEGRLSSRLQEIEADARETISGRVLPRVVDAWELIAEHSTLPGRFDSLALDLLGHSDPGNRREIRRLASWALQHLQVDRTTVPVGQTLGRMMDPDSQGWRSEPGVGCVVTPPEFEEKVNLRHLSRTLALLQTVLGIWVTDPTSPTGEQHQVAVELIRNATTVYPGTQWYPLDDLAEVIGEIHRVDPLQTGVLSAGDIGSVLWQVGDYLLDEARGIEKLYVMIDRRDGW